MSLDGHIIGAVLMLYLVYSGEVNWGSLLPPAKVRFKPGGAQFNHSLGTRSTRAGFNQILYWSGRKNSKAPFSSVASRLHLLPWISQYNILGWPDTEHSTSAEFDVSSSGVFKRRCLVPNPNTAQWEWSQTMQKYSIHGSALTAGTAIGEFPFRHDWNILGSCQRPNTSRLTSSSGRFS